MARIGNGLFISVLSLALGLVSYTPVLAASTATVTATVTVQNVSVTVSSGTVDWGTLPVNTASSTNAAYTQVVTNAGNVAEDLTVKGQNSANWTLDTANTTQDHYVQSFCTATCGSAPTNYTALTTTNQTLVSNLAASGTANVDLYILTPQTVSGYTQQSVDITVTAAAH